MKNLVAAFTDHLKEAIQISEETKLSPSSQKIDQVLIIGMGGSGIGGSIASQILEQEIRVPVLSSKTYSVPAYVSENTLIIASSFSGNTEETLSALNEAGKKTSNIVCLTSGGKIVELAEKNNYEVVLIPGGMPPRAALGFSFPQLFNILSKKGLIEWDNRKAFEEAIALLETETERIKKEALEIAKVLFDKTPVIYAESTFEGVCIRFRQQINENSKKLCWHHVIPEMNHNELVGWKADAEDIAVVMLRNESDLARNQKRMELSKDVFKKYRAHIIEVYSKGQNKLERSLYLIHLCDWVSVYIAEINHTDPIEIKVIEHFKGELAKSS